MSDDTRSRTTRGSRRSASPSPRGAQKPGDLDSTAPAGPRASRRAERRAVRPNADYFLIVLIVLALAKAWLSRALGLGAAGVFGLALEASAIVFVLCLVDILLPRRSYTLDLVAYSVLSVVMLANVIYVAFFGAIFSPHLLSVVGQAADVQDSIVALLKPVYLLYLIDIPILAAWAVLSYKVRRGRPARQRRWVAVATGVALVVLVVQLTMTLAISEDVDGRAVADARGFGPYQLASLIRLGLPDPAASTAAAFESQKGLTPEQAAAADIEKLRKADRGARIGGIKYGQYKGKNVIVVQVEALQDFVINKSYNGQVITPNLNKLVKQSWYFPNTYAQVSAGNTVDAEFAVNASMYPPATGAASVDYADREIPGLPRLLRAQGYDAVTMHANDARFWNRRELYPALGFRQWWDKSYFKDRDKMWRASDQAYFAASEKILGSEEASGTPFYAFLITMSSHTPFNLVPKARRPVQMSASDYKTMSGLYVGAISYTDLAIGEFVDSLHSSGLWDNSIVVIYGDHAANLDHGAKANDSKIADEILGRPYSDVDRERIPLIVHLPGQSAAHVSTKPVGQVDIMPTIAELVGLDLSAVPHMGRSAFVDSPSLILTRSYEPGGTFIDNTAIIVPGLSFDDAKAYSVASGAPVATTRAQRDEYALAQRLSLLSDAWIKSLPIRPDALGTKGAIIPGRK